MQTAARAIRFDCSLRSRRCSPASSDLTERKSVVPPSPPAHSSPLGLVLAALARFLLGDRRRISKSATFVVARSSSGTYEDAKRVPGGIRVDKQWLNLVIRSVPEEAGAESQRTLMLDLQVAQGWHGGVEVQHLRPRAFRPRRFRQVGYLLERQPGSAGAVAQHEPLLPVVIRRPVGWWLVTRAVLKAQQLSIELRERAGIFAVQNDLTQSWCGRFSGVTHVRNVCRRGRYVAGTALA
jgi:hypothetical protein